MDSRPVRVAQVIGKLSAGGVESVVNNYYQQIDRTKFQFDFYIDADSSFPPRQDLIDMGARYFVIPPYQKLLPYITTLIKLFKENQYQIVHSHMNTLAVFSLFAAWAAGVPVRICHNHSTADKGELVKNVMKYALRPFAKLFATDYCACSQCAGEWLFGRRAVQEGRVAVFHNAIDLERFGFDPDLREAVREEMGLQKSFVIGHVGRFCWQKNHDFLIDIFAEVYRQRKDAVLLLVGNGSLMDKMKKKVHRLKLDNAVRFLGVRSDVSQLYQAMDVFVLPSRYEGLGIVNVEAQAAGLPCIVSDRVPEEAKITENLIFFPLKAGAARWAELLPGGAGANRKLDIRNPAFNIVTAVGKLQQFYTDSLNVR